jgi:hypothetical protein
VGEDGPFAAGKDGGHPAAAVAELAVSDGVDAAVDAVKAAGCDSATNSSLTDSGLD